MATERRVGEEKTMRISKILAVVAAAVVAVACNGISPTSPAATVASDDGTARVDAKAWEPPEDCIGITEVQMLLLPDVTDIRVKAVYLEGGEPARCWFAPVWSSRPRGRLVPTKDAFVVKVTQTQPPTAVLVTAQAPNGVQGNIWVK
jgi:hypothetical protein